MMVDGVNVIELLEEFNQVNHLEHISARAMHAARPGSEQDLFFDWNRAARRRWDELYMKLAPFSWHYDREAGVYVLGDEHAGE